MADSREKNPVKALLPRMDILEEDIISARRETRLHRIFIKMKNHFNQFSSANYNLHVHNMYVVTMFVQEVKYLDVKSEW